MSALGSHSPGSFMASVTTVESLGKPPMRQLILYLSHEGLLARRPPPQRVETDAPAVQIHLRSDQAVRPGAIDREAAAQQFHRAAGRRPPQKHQSPTRLRLQV